MNKQRRKEIKNNKGVTLIAIIITIICIGILAGISLSGFGGSEGILDKTKIVVEKSKIESERTGIELSMLKLYSKKRKKRN